MFRLAYPEFLFLLLPVAALLFQVWRKKPRALSFSGAYFLGRLAGTRGTLYARVPLVLRTAVLLLLVAAICRPQTYNVSRDVRSPGVDILLCLDTSGSMRALDFTLDGAPVTRLTAVQKVVSDFVKKREHDRIGLVVFGTHAFTQAPLTLDKGLLLTLIGRLESGMAGDSTAIGDALALAGKRLKDIAAKSKIIILLTDGRHNAGKMTPPQATSALASLDMRIYTIGVGGRGPAPFKVPSPRGDRIVYQDVDLDEQSLKDIASAGRGRYFRAADSRELREVYDAIDKAEKTEVKMKEFFHFRERFAFFLVPAMLCLLTETVLRAFGLRTVP